MLLLSHTGLWALRPEGSESGGQLMEGVLLSAVGPQHAELLIVLTLKSAAAAAFSGAEGTSHAQMLGPSEPWAAPVPLPVPGPAAVRVHPWLSALSTWF